MNSRLSYVAEVFLMKKMVVVIHQYSTNLIVTDPFKTVAIELKIAGEL